MHESFAHHITEQGYFVAKSLLDATRDISPLRHAAESTVDAMAQSYQQDATEAVSWDKFSQRPFSQRFAYLLGISQGKALHHLDPLLNLFAKDYRWRTDLPDPRLPQMFSLIRHEQILNLLEEVIGPEITASPIYHFNLKLPIQDLKLADEVAATAGADLSKEGFFNFQVGQTAWHMDAVAGLKDSHQSQIINAWIPLTPSTSSNGCLLVVPGSHRDGIQYRPRIAADDPRVVALPVEPGDVVFLDNKILHASTPNTSEADFRWAYNFRYLPTGQPNGRPFLPSFIARSRAAPTTELHDPELWRAMWRSALSYLNQTGSPVSYVDIRKLRLPAAEAITQEWTARTPVPKSWLQLSPSPPQTHPNSG